MVLFFLTNSIPKALIEKWASLGISVYDFLDIKDKISYEAFKELLEESWCNADVLSSWLDRMDVSMITYFTRKALLTT